MSYHKFEKNMNFKTSFLKIYFEENESMGVKSRVCEKKKKKEEIIRVY